MQHENTLKLFWRSHAVSKGIQPLADNILLWQDHLASKEALPVVNKIQPSL